MTLPPPSEDEALAARLRTRLDAQTKPPGSLGRLEALALAIGRLQRTDRPALRAPELLVFAADHGLVAQGVSAYPGAVTRQMVQNMLEGGAAVSVLARRHRVPFTLVDMGVVDAPPPHPGLVSRRIGPGTADSSLGPAMTAAQCEAAIEAGAALVRARPGDALLVGEMGIGNTSAAALLLARLAGVPIAEATGRGTGLDDAGLAHKRQVLAGVLARHAGATAPLAALAAFGGFEIAAMAGAIAEAARRRRVVVIDGFIAGSAVLVARALEPAVPAACVYSHRGAEAGHAAMLAHLGAEPLLDLGLRLGEGSGALLAWPLITAALALLEGMATFESAGVSARTA
jgi:nicotinate-nucleotide--dimethylbenzimidazole phosphoribosyltransferase